ncbi:hypothetical protein DAPPUDRAFT_331836 [Daphnia pulex]|uniref:Protein kinase domain-containing protein n=1 Tax=Daphnia pulex TaxID=6669 RepID=E9HNK7_DAPPU|nr:hypothetical protein DAPPUDRAFT_331836 [Daphnia pulex]|eukprot:EFX66697.1 hypothetical protein DAPPUDRAFT_331836 [Daphnia pulex]
MLTFDRTKILGIGGFATVYEGIWGETKVAVKRISIEKAASNEPEVKALQMLDHRNVIKLFHVEEDLDFKIIALELCDASLDRLFLLEDDPKKYRGPMPPETEVLLQLATRVHSSNGISPSRYQATERAHPFGFYNPTSDDELYYFLNI